jgi:RNA polymerase sigma-70 factor (ECF subfamily)
MVYEPYKVTDPPLDETELIHRARQGDLGAYDQLVRRFQDLSFRTACLVGSPDEAEDAVQEAFIKAYRALSGFRHGAPFRPWLLRIVANEARNRRRAGGRRAALALRVRETANPEEGVVGSPEDAVLVRERREQLADAIGRLTDEHRLVVTCRYLLGLSETETAETLGIPAGTVKSRLSRSLERLRIELAETVL